MKRPRNTKICRKVVHPTGNNEHQFEGQRQRSMSPSRHNVETGSASYLPNGKAYELKLGVQIEDEDTARSTVKVAMSLLSC